MKKIEKYYIKIATGGCLVKTRDVLQEIKISDEEGQETILLDQIGCFWIFEQQMENGLKKIGLKSGIFKKNVAYVGFNMNGTANSMKDIFTSFEHIGFEEVYAVSEQLALIKYVFPDRYKGVFLNVYLGQERIDICLIKEAEIVGKSSMTFTKSILDKMLEDESTRAALQLSILATIDNLIGNSDKESEMKGVFFGERMDVLPLSSIIARKYGLQMEEVRTYKSKLLLGMELLVNDHGNDPGVLYRRLTL